MNKILVKAGDQKILAETIELSVVDDGGGHKPPVKPEPPVVVEPPATPKRQVTAKDFDLATHATLDVPNAPGLIVYDSGTDELLVQAHERVDKFLRFDPETLQPKSGEAIGLTRTTFEEFAARVEDEGLGTKALIADVVVGHGWLVVSFWAYYSNSGKPYPKVYCRHLESGKEVWARPRGELEREYGVQVFGGGLCALSAEQAAKHGGRRFACGWDVSQGTATSANGPSWIFFDPELLVDEDEDGVWEFDDLAKQFYSLSTRHPNWNPTTKLRDRIAIDTDEFCGLIQVGSTGVGKPGYKLRDSQGRTIVNGYYSTEGEYIPIFVTTSSFPTDPSAVPESETWENLSDVLPGVRSTDHKRQYLLQGAAHDPRTRRVWLCSPRMDGAKPGLFKFNY